VSDWKIVIQFWRDFDPDVIRTPRGTRIEVSFHDLTLARQALSEADITVEEVTKTIRGEVIDDAAASRAVVRPGRDDGPGHADPRALPR
jgi:hypothetical protein